jgi:hypothetical protein
MSEFAVGSVAYAAFCARNEDSIRDAIEEQLSQRAYAAEDDGDPKTARKLWRVLHRRRLFNRVVEKVLAETVPGFLADKADGRVQADGEIIQRILDWFAEPANWQSLLQFITALIQMFGMFAGWMLPLLAWCGLAMSGAAAQGQIICQDQYPAYTQILLDVEPVADSTYRHILWQFEPARISGMQLADGRMVFTAPPGRYEVLASVVSGSQEADRITIAENGHQLHRASFVIGDAGDDQIDDDDDGQVDPPPPPVVIEGAMVLVVEESAERTPATAKLLADAAYWQTIVDRGMRWRVYDIDSPTAAGLREQIGQTPLPALIVTDKAAKVLAVQQLPTDKAGVDRTIKEATGK